MTLSEKHNLIWRGILDEFDSRPYTSNSPLIKLNPFGWAPLSAIIIFNTGCLYKGKITAVTVKGKKSDADIRHTYDNSEFSSMHSIPVAGLYPDYNNTVEVSVKLEDGREQRLNFYIKTNPIHGGMISFSINGKSPVSKDKLVDGLYFISPRHAYTFAIDAYRDIRWCLSDYKFTNERANELLRLNNGHFLMTRGPWKLVEIDIIGRVYKEYELKNKLHHDYENINDRKILITTEASSGDYIEDWVGVYDLQQNTLQSYMDFKDILPKNRIQQPDLTTILGGKIDWLHVNKCVATSVPNMYLTSGRHQNIVFASMATGEMTGKNDLALVWILGSHDHWDEEYRKYLLKPVDKDGNEIKDKIFLDHHFWCWGQHSVLQKSYDYTTSTINILIFNNGNFRSYDKAYQVKSLDNWSECVEYEINMKDMTVKRVWDFGIDLGSRYYCSFVGNIQDLGPNYLMNHGGIHLDQNGNNIGIELADPDIDRPKKARPLIYIFEYGKDSKKILFDCEISCGEQNYVDFFTFKVVKMNLYPDNMPLPYNP